MSIIEIDIKELGAIILHYAGNIIVSITYVRFNIFATFCFAIP